MPENSDSKNLDDPDVDDGFDEPDLDKIEDDSVLAERYGNGGS